MRTHSFSFLCLSLLAPALSAQTIVGTVRDSATSAPIAGAFVEVVNPAGARVSAGLSDPLGHVRFDVGPGAWRLRAEVAGYADALVPLQLAPAEEVRALELDLAPHPLTLPAEGIDSGRCRLAEDAAGGVAGLWSELQKLLRLARWSVSETGLMLVTRRFERSVGGPPAVERLNPNRVWLDTIEGSSAIAAVTLIDGGARGSGGMGEDTVALHAPTPESLLSPGFADDHCFSARRGEGRIALEFSPMHPARDSEDGGAVWLDLGGRGLQQIDFSWSGRGRSRIWRAHVSYEFMHSPEGYLFVRRWTIRVPQLGGWVRELGAEVTEYWLEEP